VAFEEIAGLPMVNERKFYFFLEAAITLIYTTLKSILPCVADETPS
jgi:hypothetical protein